VCVCGQLPDNADPDSDVGASGGAAQSAGGSGLLSAGCGVMQTHIS